MGALTAVDVLLGINALKMFLYLSLQLMGGFHTALTTLNDELIEEDGPIAIH